MSSSLSNAERQGIEQALSELGFATDAGGGREGDAEAEGAYERLSTLDLETVIDLDLHEYLADLRLVAQELSFSTEPGGALDGDEEAERGLKALEHLLGRLETHVEPSVDVSFGTEPRGRLSDLSDDGLSR